MKLGDLMKVTRDDIQDFPGDTIELVLQLQKDDGWRAQRSNRNHIILLAPDGVTRYSVSRNASSAKYLAEDIRRYKDGEEMEGNPEDNEQPAPEREKFPCPQLNCNRTFTSQDHLNVHIGVDHEGMLVCPEKDCFELFDRPQNVGRHRQAKHGYVSPNRERLKERDARKAEKKRSSKLPADGEPVYSIEKLEPPLIFDEATVDAMETKTAELQAMTEDLQIKTEALESTGRKFDPSMVPGLGPRPVHPLAKPVMDVMLPSILDPKAEIQRATDTVKSLKRMQKEEPIVLDERESWTLDLKPIADMSVRDIALVVKALGFEIEMRAWKEKNDE